jgi:DNA-binding Lrp family transcriptional regulator
MALLDDQLNLRILRYLVSGEGVSINIRAMSKDLKIHRATVKRKLNLLYSSNILTRPFYPFPYLYEAYPLLILVKADMPRSKDIIDFLKDDSHIFAAFSCMEGPYNTFLIEFFKDLESYHDWREKIVKEHKIPSRGTRSPGDAKIFSNKLTFKYDPNCFINDLSEDFKNNKKININDVVLDKNSFDIFVKVMNGEHVQRSDAFLSEEIGINRKTVKKRIEILLKEKIIGRPKCFFPDLFIPPGYTFIVTMIEVKSRISDIRNYLTKNNNVSRAQEASTGRYNLLIFSAFRKIEDFFSMGDELFNKYPGSVGAIENIYLSSKMIHAIKPQKLSLAWIERKLWELSHK